MYEVTNYKTNGMVLAFRMGPTSMCSRWMMEEVFRSSHHPAIATPNRIQQQGLMNHLQRTNSLLAGLAFALGRPRRTSSVGDMFYDHLGGNQYGVTLRLYRDCGPDNVNGTVFDSQAQLAVCDFT